MQKYLIILASLKGLILIFMFVYLCLPDLAAGELALDVAEGTQSRSDKQGEGEGPRDIGRPDLGR